MRKKIHNLLNRNVKEFNKPVLFMICFLYLVIVALISYCVSTGSFAFFAFNVDGSKSVTGTYAVTPSYVYVYDPEVKYYLGQPVTGGERTGYCAIDTETTQCTSMLYSTLADCNTAHSGETCEPRTVNYLRADYTYNYGKIDQTIFLRQNINANYEITSSDVCYILNNNLRCLLGGDPMQFTTNKETLQNSFGSSNCTNQSTSYECTSGTLVAIINSNGEVQTNNASVSCHATTLGASYCEETPQSGS